ncbi:MAG: hypothetical protein HZC37_27455 [Burkholderiales bacterium]|nr:hypothetical protein [Burkholderiales bacterium]
MSKKGLADQVWDGIGNAITDVRQRVVEEGWFGRVVTGNDSAPEIAVTVGAPAQEVGMSDTGAADAPGDRGKASPPEPSPTRPPMAPPEPERPEPEPDMGR